MVDDVCCGCWTVKGRTSPCRGRSVRGNVSMSHTAGLAIVETETGHGDKLCRMQQQERRHHERGQQRRRVLPSSCTKDDTTREPPPRPAQLGHLADLAP